jgi:hypothetical protein
MSEHPYGLIFVAILTWQGLNLVTNPRQWLERHGSAADKHIRASRFIGRMFLGLPRF